MVSRRIYFVIAVVMFIVFFLFQASAVTIEMWNDYDTNPYVKDVNELPGKSDAYRADAQGEDAVNRMAVYIGDTENNIGNMVQAWALYSKHFLKTYDSFAAFGRSEDARTKNFDSMMVIIDPGGINWEEASAVQNLEAYVQSGMNLVFCRLPDVDVLEKNTPLQQLLGIRGITAKTTTVAGVHLYEGFLLGGEIIYKAADAEEERKKQDMDLTFPWYRLTSGTRVYMKGVPADESVQSEDFPPVIWEKRSENASVFVVNGSYMEDVTGLGLLSAMEAKTKDYTIYPIVNAQNLVVANYPGLAVENDREIMRRYSKSMDQVMRDVIWPTLVEAQSRSSLGFSCMMAPQFDYADKNEPDQDMLIYYMKLLNEQSAEAGISLINVSKTSVTRKLAADEAFMQKALADYRFTSVYAGKEDEDVMTAALQQEFLKDARTVVADYDGSNEILGYVTETATEQRTIANGLKYTYRQDFRTKSLETALGYSSVLVDVMQVAYPQDKSDDTWKDISENLGLDLQYYWKNFQMFSPTTVSECDERIRSFLTADYKDRQEGNTIHLDISGNQGTTWFILRINGNTIKEVDGGEWERIEANAFLIKADQAHIAIALQPVKGSNYIYEE